MRIKRNPAIGNMYQIYISQSKEDYRKFEHLIWEGYGIHKPWEIFEVQTVMRPENCITLYVHMQSSGLLNQLAQYWRGKVEYI
jgi:hypothetical protein